MRCYSQWQHKLVNHNCLTALLVKTVLMQELCCRLLVAAIVAACTVNAFQQCTTVFALLLHSITVSLQRFISCTATAHTAAADQALTAVLCCVSAIKSNRGKMHAPGFIKAYFQRPSVVKVCI
jgi:hypothetical protein